MSDVAEAQSLIRQAFPIEEYGKRERSFWAAYRHLHAWAKKHHQKLPTERRPRAIWNQEAARVEGWEKDALRHAARQREIENTRKELIETAEHLGRLDPGHYRDTITKLRLAAAEMGGEDCAMVAPSQQTARR